MVEAARGRGRLLLYCSTLDRDWNDLPIHPGFLPLVEEAVKHLARKHERMDAGEILVGRSVVLPTLDLQRLEVRAPDGKSAVFEGERLEGRSSVRFTGTDTPGIYRVFGTDKSGATHDRDELAFAVNLDPRGSDMTIVAATKLPVSGAGKGSEPASTEHRVELWHVIAAVLLLLLLIESILLQR
jgi:hypothetical protein